MAAFLSVVRDIALLVLRIVAGIALVSHGWHRWQGTGLDAQIERLHEAAVPSAEALVYLSVGFELIGGVLLIFGLATPLIGLGMVVLNVTVILTTRAEAGYGLPVGGWEYNAAQAAMGLILLCFGSGRAGVDNLFLRGSSQEPVLIDDDRRPAPVGE